MDEIDWTAFYQWKSRQTSQLSLREEAEVVEMFDNTTDPESLEMDLAFATEGRRKENENHTIQPVDLLCTLFRKNETGNNG
jgi:hypothetical protein